MFFVNIPFALNNFGQPSFLMNENYRITPAIMLLTKRLSNSLFLAEFKGCHIPECRIISDYCQCSYRRAFQQRFLRLLSYFPSLASMAELSYIDMKVPLTVPCNKVRAGNVVYYYQQLLMLDMIEP
jgi:hypothetical protein